MVTSFDPKIPIWTLVCLFIVSINFKNITNCLVGLAEWLHLEEDQFNSDIVHSQNCGWSKVWPMRFWNTLQGSCDLRNPCQKKPLRLRWFLSCWSWTEDLIKNSRFEIWGYNLGGLKACYLPPLSPWQESVPGFSAQIIWSVILLKLNNLF